MVNELEEAIKINAIFSDNFKIEETIDSHIVFWMAYDRYPITHLELFKNGEPFLILDEKELVEKRQVLDEKHVIWLVDETGIHRISKEKYRNWRNFR